MVEYAWRSRKPGEMSTGEVAAELEIAQSTVRRWSIDLLDGYRSPLKKVRRDILGRYWIPRTEVDRLVKEHGLIDY